MTSLLIHMLMGPSSSAAVWYKFSLAFLSIFLLTFSPVKSDKMSPSSSHSLVFHRLLLHPPALSSLHSPCFFPPQVTLLLSRLLLAVSGCLYITAPATLQSTSSSTKAHSFLQTQTVLHSCLSALLQSLYLDFPTPQLQCKSYEIQACEWVLVFIWVPVHSH